jgi:hypothetical protein
MVIPVCLIRADVHGDEIPHAKGYQHLPDFAIPKEFGSIHSYHPVAYLESYPIGNRNATLPREQKEKLGRLFVAAHDACVKKYRQDCPLSPDTPIYKLLVANDVRVAALPPQEGGHVVFLSSIARAIRPTHTRVAQGQDPIAAFLKRHPDLRVLQETDVTSCRQRAHPIAFSPVLRAELSRKSVVDVALAVVARGRSPRFGVVVLRGADTKREKRREEHWVVTLTETRIAGVGQFSSPYGTWLLVGECADGAVKSYLWTDSRFELAPVQ